MKKASRIIFTLFTTLFLQSIARADGLIVIHDAPRVAGHFTFAPLEVVYHHVKVDITDQVAMTSVDQEFYNPNNQQLEGTYIFPLPEGAHIDKFAMDIDGKITEAELLSSDKARSLYEEIVRKSKDPALLEYIGRDAFKVRIFPIEAHSRKRIKISYTQLMKNDSGLTEYVYPMNTEKFSSRPLKDVSVKVNITNTQPLRSVYCPSHNCDVRRDGDNKAVVGFEDHNIRPDTDFKLIFSTDPKALGINLMTYRNGNEDGYFLLMASPGNGITEKAAPQAKDITFVLDTSGSMAGAKMEQARKALKFCLANLNAEDRFDVIRFSTEPEPLFDKLQPADKANLDRADKFVNDLKAIGGTAIDAALKKALSYPTDSKRPYLIIFLTDGLPTVGENKEDRIVANIKNISSTIRIFPFGIGTDVNTHLLDRIANDTNAFSQYVLPEEDLEIKLSNFYAKIKEPMLTNVKVTYTGDVKTSQLYPAVLADLFKGQMLTSFGRYSGSGKGTVKITGMYNGKEQEFTTDVNFAASDNKQSFIPKLWATRRVGWLLDEIRMHGESKELKEEVIRLAREHGIVTPYTAYLIMEDETRRNVPASARNMREFEGDDLARARAKDAYDSTKKEAASEVNRSGGQAVANAQAMDALKATTQAPGEKSGNGSLTVGKGDARLSPATAQQQNASPQPNFGYRSAQNYNQQARVVKGRAFYQNGDQWTDSTIQSNANAKKVEIKFGTDEYFALITKHPDAAAWISLGNSVDVMIDNTIYCIR